MLPRGALDHDLVLLTVALGAAGPADLRGLDAAEARRARSFRRPDDRHGYVAAHTLKRLALGAATGEAPHALQFLADEFDKPHLLSRARLGFSLSHAPGMVAVALSRAGAVGVDVEAVANGAHHAEVAPLALHDDEAARVRGAADPAREFLRLWTAKEAAIKAEGRGTSRPMLEVRIGDGRARSPDAAWRVWLHEPSPRHVLALAWRDGATPQAPHCLALTEETLWRWAALAPAPVPALA